MILKDMSVIKVQYSNHPQVKMMRSSTGEKPQKEVRGPIPPTYPLKDDIIEWIGGGKENLEAPEFFMNYVIQKMKN